MIYSVFVCEWEVWETDLKCGGKSGGRRKRKESAEASWRPALQRKQPVQIAFFFFGCSSSSSYFAILLVRRSSRARRGGEAQPRSWEIRSQNQYQVRPNPDPNTQCPYESLLLPGLLKSISFLFNTRSRLNPDPNIQYQIRAQSTFHYPISGPAPIQISIYTQYEVRVHSTSQDTISGPGPIQNPVLRTRSHESQVPIYLRSIRPISAVESMEVGLITSHGILSLKHDMDV